MIGSTESVAAVKKGGKPLKPKAKKYPYPVKNYAENLLITKENDVWAYYYVRAKNINMQDKEKVESFKQDFRYTLQELSKRYKSFDFSVYPFEVNLTEQFSDLADDFNEQHKDVAVFYAEKMVDILRQQKGNITRPRFVLGVKLKQHNEVTSRLKALKESGKSVTSTLQQLLFGANSEDEQLFAEISQDEKDLYGELVGFQAERLSSEDTAYLLKLNILRNAVYKVSDETREQTINELDEVIIEPTKHKGVLKLTTEYGDQYMSCLPISSLPDFVLNAPLFYKIQSLPYPVEFHVKANALASDGLTGMKSRVANRRKLFKVNVNESAQYGDPASVQLTKNVQKTELIQNDLEEELTIFEWLGCFVVYGSTVDVVKSRMRHLKKYLGKQGVKIEFPLADQEKLFFSLIQGGELPKYWKNYTNAYALSELLYMLTSELGNNIGFYIGALIDGFQEIEREKAIKNSRKLLLINLFASNQNIGQANTASPHINITGKTGNGKSFLVKLLFYILLLMKAQVLYFDPKLEIYKVYQKLSADKAFRAQYPKFMELLDDLDLITLDVENSANYGVLDPLIFLPQNEARTVAEGIISQIYDLEKSDVVKVAVLEELGRLIDERALGERVGLRHLITRLQADENEDIKRCGNLLALEVENSLLELVFSDGQHQGIDFSNQKSVVLSVKGLSLPKPNTNPEHYDKLNRKSLAVMLCVGKYIERFGSRDEESYTFEIFDEAWTLSKTAIGQEIINRIKKIGRSQNNGCLFVTQSVSDIQSDDTKGQVGMLFAFDEDSEREEILKEVGLEVSEQNIELLKNLKQGQCIMRDIYNRTGKIAIDCLFDEWFIANETVAQTASGRLEEKYGR